MVPNIGSLGARLAVRCGRISSRVNHNLVFVVKDTESNNTVALKEYLKRRVKRVAAQ